jgi:tetratricopeptide (TPR) repeat protein
MKYYKNKSIAMMIERQKYHDIIDTLLGSDLMCEDKQKTYYIVGESYRMIHNYTYAKLFLEVSYQLDKSKEDVRYALGRIYHLLGMHDKAKKILYELLHSNHKHVHCRFRLGLIEAQGGSHQIALEHYFRIFSDLEEDRKCFYQFSDMHERFPHEPFDTVNEDLFKSVVANAIGVSYMETGDIAKAKHWFQKAIGLKPAGCSFDDPICNLDCLEAKIMHT